MLCSLIDEMNDHKFVKSSRVDRNDFTLKI